MTPHFINRKATVCRIGRRNGLLVLAILIVSAAAGDCGGNSSPTHPTPQPGTDVSGTWQGSVRSSFGPTASISLTLTQSGSSVSGTFSCPFGCIHSSGTVSGSVNGSAVTGRVRFPDGHSCDTFNGTVSGQTMSGNYACTDPLGNDNGTWSATRGSSTPAPTCSYTVSPRCITSPPTGGTIAVTVQTASSCTWNAVSNLTWVTITGGGARGNGEVNLSIAVNPGSSNRQDTVTVAQQTVLITQTTAGVGPPIATPGCALR